MGTPQTQYTPGREPALAFQVVGDGGGADLLNINALLSHVELNWEEPGLAGVTRRLAALGRTVVYDRRGVGASDPGTGSWTVADEVEDAVAVMDAAGIERAAVVTSLTGGGVGCLLAATHPARVSALVLDSPTPRQTWAPDYDWAITSEQRAAMTAAAAPAWGQGRWIAAFAPVWAQAPGTLEWMGRLERMGSSPATMRRLWATMDDVDVRAVLPSIQAPTLVVRRARDPRLDRRHALYAAEHIPGARLVELDGEDSMPWGDQADPWVDLVGEFIVGAPPPRPPTRAFAALLFTDIVDSTATVARLGDAAWRPLLERHHALAREAVQASGGRLIKDLGDGVFARFASVPDALTAALRMQHESATVIGLPLRAGVHVGDCELVGDDLAGRTVHEAARVAALAGAGEVLLSDAAHGLLPGAEIPTFDRGPHQLKGFAEPFRLWSTLRG